MRILLILWAAPLVFFWTWYGLSANDISFGTIFLSRRLHDLVFEIYGRTLGVPGSQVPAMIAWACALDSCLIAAIAALRWRASWLPQAKTMALALARRIAPSSFKPAGFDPAGPAGPALPAE